MPFRMTVLGVDVLVEVPAGTTLAAAREQFEEVTGPWPQDWAPTWGLDPGAVLGFPPLLAGTVWPPVPAPAGVDGVELVVAAGPDAGTRFPLAPGRHVVGRDEAGATVALTDPSVSRRHAELRVEASMSTVRDLGSLNGTRLLRMDDGDLAGDDTSLLAGALFAVGDTVLRRGPVPVGAAVARPDGQGHLLVNRPPRLLATPGPRTWRWPSPAPEAEAPGPPWLGLFVPLAVAVVLALVWTPLSLLLGLASPVVAGGQWWGQRRRHRRVTARAAAELTSARDVVRREHGDALQRETAGRRERHPGADEVHAEVVGRGDRLFRRRPDDPDHLTVRVGLGELPAATATLRDGEGPLSRLRDVPVVVDLGAGAVGVCGRGEHASAAVRWWVAQLAAWQAPADVRILTAAEEEWAGWFPHHAGPPADGDVLAAAVDQVRARATSGPAPGPALVVLLDPVAWWHADARLTELLTDGPAVRVHTVCVGAGPAELPPACRTVVDLGSTVPVVRTADGDQAFRPDGVGEDWAAGLARACAPLLAAGTTSVDVLPTDVHLLDLVGRPGPESVRRTWADPAPGLPAVVGADAAGPVTVDLVRDGPHTLLAGTTGAGKSVLLTTLVLALALRTPPDGLQFVLVDYKGGAAFGGVTGLPHVGGLVTDLDDQLAARVLRSLRAEVRRRERVLADAGAADVAALPPGVLPRLVVVVDEFRVLSQEVPEFVDGLVRLAAVGRSLGIHLVLATQRPAGVVSPEIRANTDLRLALRVQDRADAEDVVGDPRPATFTVPGRALLRSSSTGARSFQTARLRGPVRGAVSVEAVDPLAPAGPPRPEVDDLPGLVETVRAAADRPRPAPPWLPPLPAVVGAEEVPRTADRTLGWGLVDLPDQQDRAEARWDLDAGSHLLVVGGVRSGRTTLLRRLAVEAGARPDVEVHVLDGGGGLRDLAGTGGTASVVARDEVWRAGRVLERLQAEVEARRAGAPATDHLLLVVDGWESWSAALAAADPVAGTDPLLRLLREGSGAGLRVVVAGDRQCLTGAVSATAGQVVLLRTADRGDASLLGVRPAEVPRAAVPGRGLLVVDGRATEVQVALPRDPAAPRACRWPVAPLPRRCPVPAAAPGDLVLGRGGDDAGAVVVTADPVLLVAGPAGSGRTTALRTLAAQEPGSVWARTAGGPAVRAALAAGRLVLVDDAVRPLPPDVEDALVAALQGGEPVRVVVAGEGQELTGSFRGVAALARTTARTTVLLGRSDRVPAELVGRRPVPAPGPGPGAGFVVRDGVWTSVRVGATDCPTVAP